MWPFHRHKWVFKHACDTLVTGVTFERQVTDVLYVCRLNERHMKTKTINGHHGEVIANARDHD